MDKETLYVSSCVNSCQIKEQIWKCQISFGVQRYVLDSSPCGYVDSVMSLAHASQTQIAAWGMPVTCACVSVTSVSREVNCVPQGCVRAQRHREVDSKERDMLAPLYSIETQTQLYTHTLRVCVYALREMTQNTFTTQFQSILQHFPHPDPLKQKINRELMRIPFFLYITAMTRLVDPNLVFFMTHYDTLANPNHTFLKT